MTMTSSAREALIAELLGEVAALLNRVDTLLPALQEQCDAVTRAGVGLEERAAKTEAHIAAIAGAASTHAVKHIARKADEMARSTVDAQTRAIQAAAHELFRTELSATLRQVTAAMDKAQQRTRVRWWSYAATAIGTSLVSCAFTAYLLTH
ncbi:MAG: hypothetical protein ACT6S0_00620 [Roseateles sp.]|uniref:hypothetical protein n=1 Tax=Roseateles sp. TaxID=1971397 RepID=UPI004036F443